MAETDFKNVAYDFNWFAHMSKKNAAGRSKASLYRDRAKLREKNKFKCVCTCTCIVHRKFKGGVSSTNSISKCDYTCSADSKDGSCDSDDSLFAGGFEAAFLEENPDEFAEAAQDDEVSEDEDFAVNVSEGSEDEEFAGNESEASEHEEFGDHFNPPEDPDDPNFREAANQPDGDENDRDNFGLNHPYLNIQCHMVQNITVREVLIMCLAIAVRHSLAYTSLVDILKMLNTIFGRKYLPASKDTFFKLVGKDRAGIKKHFYCKNCQIEIENFEDLPQRFQCPVLHCNFWNNKNKLPFFVSMDVKKQLRYLLETPGFHVNLNYREERIKRNPMNIEDVLDGERYSELSQPGNVLSIRYNFSYGINNDGFRICKTSNAEAQPVYLKLNELSPLVRQRYILLAGIWIDDQPPNMNYILEKCLIEQANELSSAGLQWTRNGENVNSLFIPVYCSADAKAKALLLNLNEPTGRKSCLFCDIDGVQARGIKFPMWPYGEMEEPLPRTHASISEDMVAAIQERRMVNGFRGGSQLLNLDHFDLKTGFSTDDLHPIYVGVIKDYFERLFLPEGTHYIGVGNIAVINRRWLAIKFPTCISRKPRKILSFKRWRGTEFRNFLLYGLPCLEGTVGENIISNLSHLANAVFLLSKQSIGEDDLIQAEEDIMIFLFQFQDMFGVHEMKFNVHVLVHLVEVVRALGNLWAHSTFNFESWNHRLKKYVTSSWGTCDQVVFRLLLSNFVSAARFDIRISERVKLTMESILIRTRLDNALRVGNVHLLGSVERRQVREQERQLLQEQGMQLHDRNVLVYKRAYVNNMECRSVQYTREGRADCSNIHLNEGVFAEIQSILVVSAGEERVAGMVCLRYLLQPVPLLSNMFEVLPNNENNLSWVSFDQLNSLAVKYSVPLGTFIASVPNNSEID